MTSQSEVIRLTKLCQRQRATIKRLERELDGWRNQWDSATVMLGQAQQYQDHQVRELADALEREIVARAGCVGVKHPQQAEQGWTPPPEAQTWWQRSKSWVMG